MFTTLWCTIWKYHNVFQSNLAGEADSMFDNYWLLPAGLYTTTSPIPGNKLMQIKFFVTITFVYVMNVLSRLHSHLSWIFCHDYIELFHEYSIMIKFHLHNVLSWLHSLSCVTNVFMITFTNVMNILSWLHSPMSWIFGHDYITCAVNVL